jgi:hypothetical protein
VAPPALAIVLVAGADRRVLPALAFVPQLQGAEVRAVHVALDPAAGMRIARDWMTLSLTELPLHIEEPVDASLAVTVRALVARELRARPRVTVIVPEMDLGRWWQPLLHRGTGRALAWELTSMPNVTTVVLPVRIDLPA